ncbi:Zinc finger CCCH domain-containing protein 39 [Linum grandiflorum]
MSYSDPQAHFSQPCYQSGSDAIGIWPQFSMSGVNEQFDQPPFKRAKNSDDDSIHLTNSRMPNNPPVNRGTTCIFFKTRMCAKFKTGTCRNGENCNFAHGMQDLRQPPPNWQELAGVGNNGGGGGGGGGGRVEEDRSSPVVNWEDDQRIIHKMKLCKKFCNGEECPYGDRCNFLHEDPAKFRSDAAGRFRESAAISIGTTGMPMVQHGNGGAGDFVVRPAQSGCSDPLRVANAKPVYWKTRLCSKFEITGHCPFGDKCHFAHGIAELHANGGRVDGDSSTQGTILSKPSSGFGNGGNPSPYTTSNVAEESEGRKKCLVKWNGRKKINRIYGDWLDDLPLAQNLTNVQS